MATQDHKPEAVKSAKGRNMKRRILLNVKLIGDEDPLQIKVKLSTSCYKIINAFSDYKNLDKKFLRFLCDGETIRAEQTVSDVLQDIDDEELKDGMEIEVMYEQEGGM